MLVVAVSVAVFSTLAGAYVSFFADVSPAACIVLLQATLFVAALCLAPGKGLLRRARPSAPPPDSPPAGSAISEPADS
jgi:hypothetical protein